MADLLLTLGALLALFVVYEAFWTNLAAGRLQDQATAELEERWQNAALPGATADPIPPAVPALGEAFVRIHLPTIGDDAVFTVVEGTRNEDLRTGPGHYPDTQMPGAPGNAGLAGHRNGSGAVFQHLDQLHACDAAVVETETQWMTFRLLPVESDGDDRQAAARRCLSPEQVERVTVGSYSHVQGRHITTPDAINAISPIPGVPWEYEDQHAPETAISPPVEPSAEPARALERMLTLTTCHPQFSNAERMIVHAVLVETSSKSDGYVPDVLKE